MKKCCTCLESKALEEFYKNRSQSNGRSRRCKQCVRAHETDGNREAQRKYLESAHGAEKRQQYVAAGGNNQATARYRAQNANKRAAHIAVGNAVASGRLVKPDCCESCSKKVKLEAHHDDYTQLLLVRWLCVRCHNDWHLTNEARAA